MTTTHQGFRLGIRSKGRTILMVRHGESEGNIGDKAQGQSDVPLTENGHRQAEAVAQRLAEFNFDAVYSSDLQRAKSTAEALLLLRPDLALATRSELREAHYGDYEDTPWPDIRENDPELYRRWVNWDTRSDLRFPNGESHGDMWHRVGRFASEILDRHDQEGASILVVAHAGSLQSLLTHLLGLRNTDLWRFHFDNTSVSALREHRFMPSRWQCVLFNDTSHLNGFNSNG